MFLTAFGTALRIRQSAIAVWAVAPPGVEEFFREASSVPGAPPKRLTPTVKRDCPETRDAVPVTNQLRSQGTIRDHGWASDGRAKSSIDSTPCLSSEWLDRYEVLIIVDNVSDNLSSVPAYVETEIHRLWKKEFDVVGHLPVLRGAWVFLRDHCLAWRCRAHAAFRHRAGRWVFGATSSASGSTRGP